MKKILTIILAATFVILISGCDRTHDLSGAGRLTIRITDDPFDIDLVESAEVTITKVEIRKVMGDNEEGNPFIVLSEDTVTVDLINLRNGLTAELLTTEVPAGEYDLIRLYVDEASLAVKDYPEPFSVKVPSGKQTGIKVFIAPALNVSGALTNELLLDFDLSNSFVIRGNMKKPGHMNGFIFKPVIRASNNTTAGRIEGFVKDTAKVKVKSAKVWIETDTVVASAVADTMGFYGMLGVPAGTYTLYSWKEGFDTAKYNDIKVFAGNRTIRDVILKK